MKKIVLAVALIATLFTACNDYGKKMTVGKGELYYTENITEDEAKKAAELLKESGYLGDDKETSMQLDKKDSVYRLRLVVDKTYHTDTTLDYSFMAIGLLTSMQAFDSKPVEVDLCDELLQTKRTIK